MMATIALLARCSGRSRAPCTRTCTPPGRVRRSGSHRRCWWFVLAAALCTAATIIPLRMALRKMETFEF